MFKQPESRRRFLRDGLALTAALPVMLGTAARSASAAELPHLEESDPAAVGLKYTHDASKVDGAGDHNCANCRFYTEPGSEWGPCQLFPGKAVKASGWCAGYAAKA